MPRRLLLAARSTSIDPPPPIDPPIEPEEPGAREAIVAQLDPANYPGKVFTVGTDAETVAATLSLAEAASTEDAWSLVLIPPGTYVENVARTQEFQSWVDIASTTLDPEDVTIQGLGTGNTFEVMGIGGIIAGIHFLSVTEGRSAIHCGGGSLPYDMIFYKVFGEVAASAAGFSWGLSAFQPTYAYDCHWRGLNGGSVYCHTFAPNIGPSLLVFDDCHISGRAPGNMDAAVGINDWGSGQADRFYLKGSAASVEGGTIESNLANGATVPSFTGFIDPRLPFASVGPNFSRVLPDPLPIPVRLASFLEP